MRDSSPYPDPNSGDAEGQEPRSIHGRPPGAPRWVKIFGITIIIVVLLIVVGLLAATALGLHDPSIGPGGHGPGPAPATEVQPH
jgi:hypothetical protein